uniref:ATP synthase protein MI25 n=1 Tax=Oryza rufipogon TaxID=4529 RepID=A0A0E0RFL3_ORYRU
MGLSSTDKKDRRNMLFAAIPSICASTTLLNATSSRRIRLQDDIVTGFHFSVSERFVSGSTFKASTVEQIREAFVPIDLIREGLIVLRKV